VTSITDRHLAILGEIAHLEERKASEWLEKEASANNCRKAAARGARIRASKRAEALREVAQYLSEHRWIPVEESLPANGDEVLVALEDAGQVRVDWARFARGEFRFAWQSSKSVPLGVTHWRKIGDPTRGST